MEVLSWYDKTLNKEYLTQAYYGIDFTAGLVSNEVIDPSNSSVTAEDMEGNDVTFDIVDTASLSVSADQKTLLFILKASDKSYAGKIILLNIVGYVNANKQIEKKVWLFIS